RADLRSARSVILFGAKSRRARSARGFLCPAAPGQRKHLGGFRECSPILPVGVPFARTGAASHPLRRAQSNKCVQDPPHGGPGGAGFLYARSFAFECRHYIERSPAKRSAAALREVEGSRLRPGAGPPFRTFVGARRPRA